MPEVVTVRWDGKLLPGFEVRNSKDERLPILISFEEWVQLFAVPKPENCSCQNQAEAVSNALNDWNLNDNIQIMCYDTTACNTS